MEEIEFNIRIAIKNTDVDPNEMILYKNGKLNWNPHFKERLTDYLLLFNDVFSDLFNEKMGKSGWAIRFIQLTLDEPAFNCDIYLDKKEMFEYFKLLVIENAPKELAFNDFYLRGNESDYFATLPK